MGSKILRGDERDRPGLDSDQRFGGCRAIVDSISDLRRIEHRLRRNRPPLRGADYIAKPRASGYRAVHVVVAYPDRDGLDRAVEVQLRTPVMHEWAFTVERIGGRLHHDLKSSAGPPEVLRWLRAVSEAMAIEERGETVGKSLLAELGQLREQAMPSLPLIPSGGLS